MINPLSLGNKIVVRFAGRDFEYWNSCGWTHYRRNAVRYCYSEAIGVRNKINKSKDSASKAAVVDYVERLNPHSF